MPPPYKKLVKDKAALQWLKDHADEFPLTASLPHRQNFPRVYLVEQKFQADLIRSAMPYKRPLYQQIAELYLQMPPRKIAEHLNISRRQVYMMIFNIKAIAQQQWLKGRNKLLNGRDGALSPRSLDTHPCHIALRTVQFTFGERTKYAYLLEQDNVWVDENGKAFPTDVQEIIHNRVEDLAETEALDWEE